MNTIAITTITFAFGGTTHTANIDPPVVVPVPAWDEAARAATPAAPQPAKAAKASKAAPAQPVVHAAPDPTIPSPQPPAVEEPRVDWSGVDGLAVEKVLRHTSEGFLATITNSRGEQVSFSHEDAQLAVDGAVGEFRRRAYDLGNPANTTAQLAVPFSRPPFPDVTGSTLETYKKIYASMQQYDGDPKAMLGVIRAIVDNLKAKGNPVRDYATQQRLTQLGAHAVYSPDITDTTLAAYTARVGREIFGDTYIATPLPAGVKNNTASPPAAVQPAQAAPAAATASATAPEEDVAPLNYPLLRELAAAAEMNVAIYDYSLDGWVVGEVDSTTVRVAYRNHGVVREAVRPKDATPEQLIHLRSQLATKLVNAMFRAKAGGEAPKRKSDFYPNEELYTILGTPPKNATPSPTQEDAPSAVLVAETERTATASEGISIDMNATVTETASGRRLRCGKLMFSEADTETLLSVTSLKELIAFVNTHPLFNSRPAERAPFVAIMLSSGIYAATDSFKAYSPAQRPALVEKLKPHVSA